MMQATDDNELFDLGTARRREIPRRGDKPVSSSTVVRWYTKGINGVKLEVVYIGSKPYTDRQRLKRFFDEVTARRLARDQEKTPAVITASDAELQAAGVL